MNLKIVVTGAVMSGHREFCEALTDDTTRDFLAEEILNFEWYYWYLNIDSQNELRLIKPHDNRGNLSLWLSLDNLIAWVLVVDSSNSHSFYEARSLFQTYMALAPLPCVIAANKQDIEGAWDAESLRILFRIPPEIPIIPCVATDKKSVANVLIALCEEVLRQMEEEAET